jgi:hypothetical protein
MTKGRTQRDAGRRPVAAAIEESSHAYAQSPRL